MNKSLLLPLALLMLFACASRSGDSSATSYAAPSPAPAEWEGLHKAYFASGCFWCVEAVFESVKGVKEAVSGYSGGYRKNPSYEQVARGLTNHAEAVEVYYDSTVIDYPTLLKVFFGSQDPTTPNRQGPDRGPQYRSIVFFQNKAEKKMAQAYIDELNESGQYDNPIVTEVVPFKVFYQAEAYHQNYERLHPNQPYIRQVSIPRLNRFKAKFPELLKDEAH